MSARAVLLALPRVLLALPRVLLALPRVLLALPRVWLALPRVWLARAPALLLAALLAGCPTSRPPKAAAAAAPSPTAREVRVESTPDGAQVSAAGSPGCLTPCALHLEPGRHHLSVRKAGHLPYEIDVEVAATGTTQVTAALVSSH